MMTLLTDSIRKIGDALQVSDHPTIPFIEGDGCGADIWRASKRVIDSAIKLSYNGSRSIQWREVLAGEKAFTATREWLPRETVETLRAGLIGIKGPLSTPVGGGIRSLNVALRKEFDLYACMRPVRWYEGVPAPVCHPDWLDVVIFRENTEDLYAGIEFEANSTQAQELLEHLESTNPDMISDIRFPSSSAFALKPISREGSARLVRAALRYALEHGRNKVSLVHKGNIMKYTEGGFRNWGYEVAETEFNTCVYTQRQLDEVRESNGDEGVTRFMHGKEHMVFVNDVIADAAFEIALTRPKDLDVIATTNLNGDYLSDALAAQVGGLGIAPGVNLNPESGAAIFEATHGTAPALAGKDLANPGSLLLSAVLMLRYMGWELPANKIESAFSKTIQEGKVTQDLTRFIPGVQSLTTSAFSDRIIEIMEQTQ